MPQISIWRKECNDGTISRYVSIVILIRITRVRFHGSRLWGRPRLSWNSHKRNKLEFCRRWQGKDTARTMARDVMAWKDADSFCQAAGVQVKKEQAKTDTEIVFTFACRVFETLVKSTTGKCPVQSGCDPVTSRNKMRKIVRRHRVSISERGRTIPFHGQGEQAEPFQYVTSLISHG